LSPNEPAAAKEVREILVENVEGVSRASNAQDGSRGVGIGRGVGAEVHVVTDRKFHTSGKGQRGGSADRRRF